MSYLKIAKHYDDCYKQHGNNHLGVDWPNYEDTLKRHQVMFDLVKYEDSTLLDFGCGLGHFYEWIKTNQKQVHYSGLDINENFYNSCKTKFPSQTFYHLDIFKDNNLPNFDYITINGVFTEKLELTQEEMWGFFTSVISKLWEKCNKGIAFNLMSKHVDWEREDLFHVGLDELGWYLKDNLSRNFVIRNDYKLYEYTTYVYKN
jgi:cyclopropane fatty-acyl-phospholipid synthase-like methyltransferase